MDDRLTDALLNMIISLIPHVDMVELILNDEDRRLFIDALLIMLEIREENKKKER
jgi:hypothetical protein